jgi:hypothetical protein
VYTCNPASITMVIIRGISVVMRNYCTTCRIAGTLSHEGGTATTGRLARIYQHLLSPRSYGDYLDLKGMLNLSSRRAKVTFGSQCRIAVIPTAAAASQFSRRSST